MLRLKLVLFAVALAFAMVAFAPANAVAQKSCSQHLSSCERGCANSRTPNHWSCVKGNSCQARYKKCMRDGTWTSLTRNPGTRLAPRW